MRMKNPASRGNLVKIDIIEYKFISPIHLPAKEPSAIDSESIKSLSVLHSGLKREW